MTGSVGEVDPPIPCPSGNCGDTRFRSAVPSRDTVRIQMGRTASHDIGTQIDSEVPGLGRAQQALESVSPALVETEAYVQDINASIDELFESFEILAATEPEVADENLHIWRGPSEDDPSLDELLVVTAIDDLNYTVELMIGPADFDATQGISVIAGHVELADEETKNDFEITIDLDAASDAINGLGLTGEILISAQPLAGGLREIWYDYAEVGELGGDLESSRTTYWIFDVDSGALEYLYDLHDESATAYVRWDAGGGRYDHHVAWVDADYGLVDEIVTNCWDDGGTEVFDAFALIDQDLSYYGELDGDEIDCEFGPVEDHPEPGADFDNLPGEGEWDEIDFGGDVVPDCTEDPTAPGCDAPLCADDPSDPDCIPWCDDEPSDPDCLWYCDIVDDPDYCDGF